jgi:two-component system, chemotaxis family, CheB/CheR fusion protein
MRHHAKTTVGNNSLAIVAVGASAGGLEAFSQLLRAIPNNTGMAFVFIQHLDPKHHSMLSDLLAKAANMPVQEATNGTTVQPNHVYVIPPNVNLGINRHRLQLTPRAAIAGLHTPIDFFMRSLAEERNSRSIGVVLSGTASDGTRGLAALKAEGGITFAQDEESAKYPGMPHSAVASGCVDFVLPPEKIARELARISGHRYLNGSRAGVYRARIAKTKRSDDTFQRIFTLLRTSGGISFSLYKPGTVERRTLRRMAIHRIDQISEYAKFLEKHPKEIEALCQDLLIPVTSFFRDLEAFESLKGKVFPAILKDKSGKESIRIWAPGCSTGEETYSLAIILFEFLGDKMSSYQIQLFGTDVNERGIERARAGIYGERIAEEVSAERLRRFFTKVDDGYRVTKSVRDLCVFAKQNLAEDPPFSRMNLVACRNLLIYLGPELQRKVVPILHYALKPTGFLFLGNAESVAGFSEFFAPLDKKHKIFVKKSVASKLHYDFSANRNPRETRVPDRLIERSEADIGVDRQQEADHIVLRAYAPPGVVIDENMEILQFRGAIGSYIEPVPGRATLNLLKIAKREFVAELRTAVNQAKKTHTSVNRKSVEFKRNGQLRSVNISVEALGSATENHRQYLVLFDRALPNGLISGKLTAKSSRGGRATKTENTQLRRKLAEAEEYLRSLVESKEASDEEYQSANEEILSANEELQSTNEELETSKEELQSANEELNTVNDELHNRNIELDRVNSDLTNVLISTSLPVVMVDRGLRIRRLTAASAKVLKIVPSDIGRPISDIRWDVDVPDMDGLIAGVVETLAPKELEVQAKDGHWYSLQIRPYRTTDDKIDGAVIVLSDINEAKEASERIEKAKLFMEEALATVREPLLVLKQNLSVIYANPSFLKTFHVRLEETQGKLLYQLGNGQWNIPKLRAILGEVLSKDVPVLDFEVEHDFPNLGTKTMLLNARKIEDGHNDEPTMLLAIEDISGRKQADAALRESEERYHTLFDLGPIGVYSCDASGVLRDFNRRAVELWGRQPKSGDSNERWCGSFKMHRPDGVLLPHGECPMADVLSGKIPEARDAEVQIERPDGSRITVIVNIRPLKNERGEILGAINCFVDITERKQAEEVRARLAAVVESSDDAMISKTLDGTITTWNKGAERLLGYTAEEAIGKDITLIVPPDRLQEEAEILERLRHGNRIEHFETIRKRKDGSLFDVSLTISPVKDGSGRIVGASKVARDVTDKKVAERTLQQAHDRLESMVEERTASVRQLSLRLLTVQDEEHRSIARELHDSVGQHLAGIKMDVDRLRQPESADKQLEMLSKLSESLERCMSETRTISHLLHPPLLDELGFSAAAKWYIDGFSERSGIKVNTESSNSRRLPPSVELPLFRILQASLSNVHRHSDSSSVDVRFSIDEREARLEVKDYGKGIDPGLLRKFNQSGGGAGIGLAGMRERLRELGGRLEVESDTNGTMVCAVVPISESAPAKKSEKPGSTA